MKRFQTVFFLLLMLVVSCSPTTLHPATNPAHESRKTSEVTTTRSQYPEIIYFVESQADVTAALTRAAQALFPEYAVMPYDDGASIVISKDRRARFRWNTYALSSGNTRVELFNYGEEMRYGTETQDEIARQLDTLRAAVTERLTITSSGLPPIETTETNRVLTDSVEVRYAEAIDSIREGLYFCRIDYVPGYGIYTSEEVDNYSYKVYFRLENQTGIIFDVQPENDFALPQNLKRDIVHRMIGCLNRRFTLQLIKYW